MMIGYIPNNGRLAEHRLAELDVGQRKVYQARKDISGIPRILPEHRAGVTIGK